MHRSMHRSPAARTEATEELDLTSMLDVVFIMLIFFVVTATFLDEHGLDLPPTPEASPPKGEPTAPILVVLTDAGAIRVDGRLVTEAGVRPHLERLHASRPDAAVVVLSEPESTAAALVAVVDGARLTGIDDVQLRRR